MAKKRGARDTVAYQGYIPVYLSDEDKAKVKKSIGDASQLLKRVVSYVEDDYKFGFSWSDANECYVASLFDMNPKRPAAGFILAANHVDELVCLSILVYLHEEVYPDGWDIESVRGRQVVNW